MKDSESEEGRSMLCSLKRKALEIHLARFKSLAFYPDSASGPDHDYEPCQLFVLSIYLVVEPSSIISSGICWVAYGHCALSTSLSFTTVLLEENLMALSRRRRLCGQMSTHSRQPIPHSISAVSSETPHLSGPGPRTLTCIL